MLKLLMWLDGKKTFIVSFLQLTAAYISLKGWISQDDAAYIQAVLALFAGGAEAATVAKLGASRRAR